VRESEKRRNKEGNARTCGVGNDEIYVSGMKEDDSEISDINMATCTTPSAGKRARVGVHFYT
jgi:hypothetical protein